MTLVLSCATQSHIFLASDRILSTSQQIVSKDWNKVIVVQGRFVFGYSGPDYVGDVKTDEWIGCLCAEACKHGSDWIPELQRKLANQIPLGVQFALSGFGWVNGHEQDVSATHFVFSNSMDVDTGHWGRVDQEAILMQWRRLAPNKPVMFGVPTGNLRSRSSYRTTQKLIVKAVRAGRTPDVIANYLADEIRRSANADTHRVGGEILITVLPRPGGPDDELRELCVPMAGMTPRYDTPLCYAVGPRGDLAVWQGPVYVFDCWAIKMYLDIKSNGDYSVEARTLVAGMGYAGAYMDAAGQRIGILNRQGLEKSISYQRRGVPPGTSSGLFCPHIIRVELPDFPTITSLMERDDYVVLFECGNCPSIYAYTPKQIVRMRICRWGLSFRMLARLFECPHCRRGRAKRAYAAVRPREEDMVEFNDGLPSRAEMARFWQKNPRTQ